MLVLAITLGAGFIEGIEDDEAGFAPLAATLLLTVLHDAGTEPIVSFASWSDCFSESFFLITWSRSEQADW